MNNYIEIQRNNVTVAEFLRYVKVQCTKKGLCFDITRDDFENPYALYNEHYYVRDGIKYVKVPNGPAQEWDGTDAPCKAETYRILPYDFQTYMLNWDGSCYNEICEFSFDDDKRGYGYYYQINVEADTDTDTDTEDNEKLFAELMSETGATYEEAYTMCELDCSLEEARQHLEYENEKSALMPELIRFFNGDTNTAEEVAEEMAWGLVYA